MRKNLLLSKALLLVSLWLLPQWAFAWSNITLLTSNSSPAITEFTAKFKAEFSLAFPNTPIHEANNQNGLSIHIPNDTFLIAIGTQSLLYASHLDERTPVLGVFVPKLSYEKILKESSRDARLFSAIYLDQPFERQIGLIKLILPKTKQLSILLGPSSQFLSTEIQQAAKLSDTTTTIQLVEHKKEIQEALNISLTEKAPILAVPDSLIYSRETAQNMLLTTYRHRVPLFGFSQSYVSSGAIAAVFTSPSLLAEEVADLISNLANNESLQLAPARYPNSFEINLNTRVARALGIALPDQKMIKEQLTIKPKDQKK